MCIMLKYRYTIGYKNMKQFNKYYEFSNEAW